MEQAGNTTRERVGTRMPPKPGVPRFRASMAEPRVPKAERRRLAKAELLLNAAVTVQRWANDLTGKNPTAPFEEWGDDDPFVSLCRRYALTPADLAKIAEGIAEQLEARAERAGYAEAWINV